MFETKVNLNRTTALNLIKFKLKSYAPQKITVSMVKYWDTYPKFRAFQWGTSYWKSNSNSVNRNFRMAIKEISKSIPIYADSIRIKFNDKTNTIVCYYPNNIKCINAPSTENIIYIYTNENSYKYSLLDNYTKEYILKCKYYPLYEHILTVDNTHINLSFERLETTDRFHSFSDYNTFINVCIFELRKNGYKTTIFSTDSWLKETFRGYFSNRQDAIHYKDFLDRDAYAFKHSGNVNFIELAQGYVSYLINNKFVEMLPTE